MRTEKEHGAIRIMESMSAVSEELLERCEKAGPEKKLRKGKVRRYVYRYALACAACLCLIVAGTAYYRQGFKNSEMSGSGGDMNNMGAAQDVWDGAAPGDTFPEEGAENAENQSAGNIQAAERNTAGDPFQENYALEPQWMDVNRLAALPAETEQDSESENLAKQETDASIPETASRKPDLKSRAEAAEVPEGYSLVQSEGEEPDSADTLVCSWSNGEYSLWLRITQTSLTADMQFETAPPVYSVRQEWQELIPDAGADGYVRFALLYEDGILAEYCGKLDMEEIITLMESFAVQSPAR